MGELLMVAPINVFLRAYEVPNVAYSQNEPVL